MRCRVHRFGVVVSLAVLLALLGYDAGMALSSTYYADDPSSDSLVGGEHPQPAFAQSDKAPQSECHADADSLVAAGQDRLALPAVLADAEHQHRLLGDARTVEPTSVPPLSAIQRRTRLQVFLN